MIPRFLSKLLSPMDPMPSADRARRSGPLSPERRASEAGRALAMTGAERRRLNARAQYKQTHDAMRLALGLDPIEWKD